jgi:RNA-directed DNA polymerase
VNSAKPFLINKREVWNAWLDVKENAGAHGIDKVTLTEFESDLNNQLYKIWNRLSSGSYLPPPVRRVGIPKKSGGTRYLGVPTIADRVAQGVIKRRIEPKLEKIFLSNSYGFRPKKSALQAIEITKQRCWKYNWVLEFDIRGLFDNIPHDLMLKAVAHNFDCKMTLLYIRRWLKAKIVAEDGSILDRGKGTPQGGIISPLLSNLFLHYVFDVWMGREFPQAQWCRYADDGLVHCRTKSEAQLILDKLSIRFRECGIELHPVKTRIIYCKDSNRTHKVSDPTSFNFLGFCFRVRRAINNRTRNIFGSFLPGISKEALQNIKDRIKWGLKFRRRTELSLEEIAEYINPVLRGWFNYYGHFYKSAMINVVNYVDQHIIVWFKKKYSKSNSYRYKAWEYLREMKQRKLDLFEHWRYERLSMGAV